MHHAIINSAQSAINVYMKKMFNTPESFSHTNTFNILTYTVKAAAVFVNTFFYVKVTNPGGDMSQGFGGGSQNNPGAYVQAGESFQSAAKSRL